MQNKIFDIQRFADISNSTSDTVVVGTADADSISNTAKNVTISALDGNDIVKNKYSYFGIYADQTGTHTISSGSFNSKIYGGAGDDTLSNSGNYSMIYGETGNDSIYTSGEYSTVYGGDGDDTIEFRSNATVNGGLGNDWIYSYNQGDYKNEVMYQYSVGDGNDTIEFFYSQDTLQIDGSYVTELNGNDFIVRVGTGSITLKDSKYKKFYIADFQGNTTKVNWDWTLIPGTAEDDTIINDGTTDSIKIDGYEGNDIITNAGEYVTITGGFGDDTIYNHYKNGDNALIYGEDGSDSIYNSCSTVTIDSGNGNDTVYNSGEHALIYGGAGDDSIHNRSSNNVTINAGEGNDSLTNLGDYVTMDGGNGNNSISNENGSNVMINAGEGNDTIYNENGSNVTINAGEGNDTISNKNGSNVTIDGGSGDDYICNSYNTVPYGGWYNNNYYLDSSILIYLRRMTPRRTANPICLRQIIIIQKQFMAEM